MTSCSAPQVGQIRMSPISGISSSVGIGELHSWQDGIVLDYLIMNILYPLRSESQKFDSSFKKRIIQVSISIKKGGVL